MQVWRHGNPLALPVAHSITQQEEIQQLAGSIMRICA